MTQDAVFNAESVGGIIEHMNDDHRDALLLYLDAFTDVRSGSATDVEMTGITGAGITIRYTVDGNNAETDIGFQEAVGKTLSDPAGARAMLVQMVKLARERLAE